jgi:hypothetical protein
LPGEALAPVGPPHGGKHAWRRCGVYKGVPLILCGRCGAAFIRWPKHSFEPPPKPLPELSMEDGLNRFMESLEKLKDATLTKAKGLPRSDCHSPPGGDASSAPTVPGGEP